MRRSYENIVKEHIIPIRNKLCDEAVLKKHEMNIDGIVAFGDHIPFSAGGMFNTYTHIILNEREDEIDDRMLNTLKDLLMFSLEYKVDTFGILSLLSSLYTYKKEGMLEKLLDDKELQEINNRLDWRVFVEQDTLKLKGTRPFNYYSVAFRVAKLREKLGFETEKYSDIFLNIYLEHAKKCSINGWYMDETMGEGRFDRYTTIVPAELADLYDFVGEETPESVKIMLRKSCDIYLKMANEQGYGYAYGRSLGAHGDTGAIEVLPISAKIGILNEEETNIAYAYTVKCAQRIVDFWFDKETELVNLWDKGRTIDEYRNKSRIFGVNIDICMKLVYAGEIWKELDLCDKLPIRDYSEKLLNMGKTGLYIFDQQTYKRGLALVRDREHVFQLPIINGGKGGYGKTAYLPLPYETFFIEGTPDEDRAYLTPQLILNNGIKLMPLSYFSDIEENIEEDCYTVCYKTDALCKIGEKENQKYDTITSITKYVFKQGSIIREDEFYISGDEKVDKVIMEFNTFSDNPLILNNRISFGEGLIKDFECNMKLRSMENVCDNAKYFTPNGPTKYTFKYEYDNIDSKKIKIRWKINY
ncbi:MAG: hypothetical protein N4A63_04700 [Vallitalea sp.]|jgi:hypothetical protein|nr:hypothetical protein [Vallitalea sp.]